jgi:hypothetical protein
VLKKIIICTAAAAVATAAVTGIAYADTDGSDGRDGTGHSSFDREGSTESSPRGDSDREYDSPAMSYGDDGPSDDQAGDRDGANGRDGRGETTYDLLGGL